MKSATQVQRWHVSHINSRDSKEKDTIPFAVTAEIEHDFNFDFSTEAQWGHQSLFSVSVGDCLDERDVQGFLSFLGPPEMYFKVIILALSKSG